MTLHIPRTGLLKPPVGMVMYVERSVAGVTIKDFTRECWPMILVLIVVLAMVPDALRDRILGRGGRTPG
jgi:TRAP-type C4-dicarboxylate transport system permease large subunit